MSGDWKKKSHRVREYIGNTYIANIWDKGLVPEYILNIYLRIFKNIF